jgi:hypothetical protein
LQAASRAGRNMAPSGRRHRQSFAKNIFLTAKVVRDDKTFRV